MNAPSFGQYAQFLQGVKDLSVQELVSELRVEALRSSRFDPTGPWRFCERPHLEKLRCVTYRDAKTGMHLKFLTNNFILPALTIAQIYKQR